MPLDLKECMMVLAMPLLLVLVLENTTSIVESSLCSVFKLTE